MDRRQEQLGTQLKEFRHSASTVDGFYCEARDLLRKGCGTLCAGGALNPGPLSAPVSCKALFSNDFFDQPSPHASVVKAVPTCLRDDFTLGGRVPVKDFFFHADFGAAGAASFATHWSREKVDQLRRDLRARNCSGGYGVEATNGVYDMLRAKNGFSDFGIRGKRVWVLGSIDPWLEAILLELGVGEVVTIEYRPIQSDVPKLKTMTPAEFSTAFVSGAMSLFDGGVTFSSIEHAGLGRYGDIVNPWGDLMWMAKLWCATKPGGFMYLGTELGPDAVYWNAHRMYGPIRLPLLTTNWIRRSRSNEARHSVHLFSRSGIQTAWIAVHSPRVHGYLKLPARIDSPRGTCFFDSASYLEESQADALMMIPPYYLNEKAPFHTYPRQRARPGQLWISYTMGVDDRVPVQRDRQFKELINLTVSYKVSDPSTDILATYVPALNDLRSAPLQQKDGFVLAAISNCYSVTNNRLSLLKELMNLTNVTSIGKCMNNAFLPEENATTDHFRIPGAAQRRNEFMSRFKFFLAFENSNSLDFVTEKFFDPILHGVVPVYLGAPNVEKFAPGPTSFVDVRKFSSAQALVNFLLDLDRNTEKYMA